MSDEHDVPIMTIEISSRERSQLLIALWNTHLQTEEVNKSLIGTEHEFDTLMMFQSTFDLVRKLGGNPEVPMFGMFG